MACHTPPLKRVKKQGEMPLPSLGPIPSLNSDDTEHSNNSDEHSAIKVARKIRISSFSIAFNQNKNVSLFLFLFSTHTCKHKRSPQGK